MGTNYIAPTWRMPENTNKDKLSNYSMYFDNASTVNLGTPSSSIGVFDKQVFSFSVWLKRERQNVDETILSLYSSSSNKGVELFFSYNATDGNYLCLQIGDATNDSWYNNRVTNINSIMSLNVWYNITCTWDGTDSNIYINNVLRKNWTKNLTISYVTTNQPVIGANYQNAKKYLGQISSFSYFDYALSIDQRTYLYNLNNPMVISGGEPIAYYPLGDNSNPTANAGYPNISVGADSVFKFNSDRIDLGLGSSLGLGGASKYSTSLWFKKSSNSTSCLWGYNYGDANGSGWYYWLNSGNLRIATGKNGISSGFGYYEISANELPVGKWQHVVIVFNGTLSAGDDRIKVYHNGTNAVGTYFNSANFPATLPNGNSANNRNVYLGQLQLGNGSFSYNYDGELSNVQQWGTDLSLANASTLYNNGQPLMTGTQPQTANLKAWYKLNQSSNWEADSVGNWQIPDATSAFPQSFKFIAANSDAIQFGPSSGLGFNTQISISAWFNQTPGGGSLQQLVAEDKTGSSRNWGIILVSRVPNFQFFDEAGAQVQLVGTALTEGKWHHILCTATGDTSANGVKMYINGQLVAQGTASNENIKNDNIQAKIGTQTAATPTYYFDGKISNVALWNTDRSSEKDNIYNNGIPATSYTTTPQYWYKLDNTSVWNPAPANYWTFPNAGTTTDSGIFNFSN